MSTNLPSSPVNDIHDIKPPLAIPNGLAWLWWLLGALLVLLALWLVWRRIRARRAAAPPPPPVPPHVRARQKLAEALALMEQPKPFCVLVSDTVRLYLEERFDFRAPERTTQEFLRELQGTDLLAGHQKDSLGRFLESCDLVKFAKYEPGHAELEDLHHAALQLVEETEPSAAPGAAPAEPREAA